MVSYTSRLRLSKPADGEAQNIDILNANFDAIDRAISAGGPYTSTTRPSAPYVGQMIYESDTKAVRVWDGTTWFFASRREVAQVTKTSGDVAVAVGWATVLTFPLDIPAGRYEFSVVAISASSDLNDIIAYKIWDGTTGLGEWSTKANSGTVAWTGQVFHTVIRADLAAGARTITLSAARVGGNGNIQLKPTPGNPITVYVDRVG